MVPIGNITFETKANVITKNKMEYEIIDLFFNSIIAMTPRNIIRQKEIMTPISPNVLMGI